MSHQILILKSEIRWANDQIERIQKAVLFWESRVQELKAKYSESTLKHHHKHIHDTKAHLKKSKDDLTYYQTKLNQLETKLLAYQTFE